MYKDLKLFSTYSQGAAKLTKDDIEKVFSLYDRVSFFFK